MNLAVEILLDLLEERGVRGAPLDDLQEELAHNLEERRISQELPTALETIKYALDKWLVDKIIDYCENERGASIGPPKWFIRPLPQEESDRLKKLPEVEKAVINLLRNNETEHGLGTMSEDELMSRLKESGFEVDFVPEPTDMVSDFYEPDNDHMVVWYYIVPQYERSEEYKKAMEEAAMRAFEKEIRYGG